MSSQQKIDKIFEKVKNLFMALMCFEDIGMRMSLNDKNVCLILYQRALFILPSIIPSQLKIYQGVQSTA